ncbi:uncharacterized protein LOC125041272 [Penaeus chinensis]|uniref:uncharacterized protein LOC125041272 n=1 Tax=Penaeus chinensis TaxID=139456 RepID=UPI001FB5D3E7|nr:uncharacterized protein LOC125041272 [Penaeus chinensis]
MAMPLPRATSWVMLATLLSWPAEGCWPGYIEDAVKESKVVLMAKVIHLEVPRGQETYPVAEIQVREILKGADAYQDYLLPRHDGPLPLNDEATALEDPLGEEATALEDPLGEEEPEIDDDILEVEGVTTSTSCAGRIREGDTRIFFLAVEEEKESRSRRQGVSLRVTAQPVKLSLNSMRWIKAAVQGKVTMEPVILTTQAVILDLTYTPLQIWTRSQRHGDPPTHNAAQLFGYHTSTDN